MIELHWCFISFIIDFRCLNYFSAYILYNIWETIVWYACCGTIATKVVVPKRKERLKTENSYEFDRIISSFARKFGSLSWWNCPFAKVFVGSLLDRTLWPSNKSLWVAPKVLIHVKYTLYNTWDIDHSWDHI
jgi:hypothetical protein